VMRIEYIALEPLIVSNHGVASYQATSGTDPLATSRTDPLGC
jgi:hypothetical protein